VSAIYKIFFKIKAKRWQAQNQCNNTLLEQTY